MALNVGELYATMELDQTQFDQGVGNMEGRLGKLGGFVASTFAGIIAGAVAALGGAMVGAVSAVDDFNRAINGLQAQTGATADEMQSMGDMIKNIYGRNIGENFQEIGDALAYAKQTTGTFGGELESLAQNALMLRDTFGYDVNESIKASSQLMQTFGTDGTTAMAMLAEATQKGLNRSDDLIDTIDEYSVYFKTAGLSVEDMFGVLESASSAGVRNLDFVGDAFKEMVIRTKDGSEGTMDAYKALGLSGKQMTEDFAAGGEKGKAAFQTMMTALNGIQDPVEKNAIGVALFGTKFEDLEAGAVAAMGNIDGTIKGSVDTLNGINEIKYDSFGQAMQGIGRQLLVGLIMPLGEKLMPYLNDFATWISGKIPQIVSFFEQFGSKTSDVFNKIMDVVGPVMDFVGDKVMEVVSLIVEWWNQNGAELLANVKIIFEGIWKVIQFIMPAVLEIIKIIWENIKGVISGALNIIGGVIKIFAGLFTGDFSKMWDGIKQLFSGAVEFLWNLWNLLLVGRLLGGIKALASKAGSLFSSMWTGIKNGVNSFYSWIGNLVKNMVSGIVNGFKGMVDQAVSIFGTLRTFGANIFSALWQAVKTVVTNMGSGISNAFNGILNAAKNIFNSIKSAITSPIETAKGIIMGIIDAIKGAFSRLSIKIPKPVLPHIKVGSKQLFGGKGGIPAINIPTFSIDWYKTGGIATGPAIAGIGEAGSEAIVPLSGRRMKPFADEISKQIGQNGNQIGSNFGPQTVIVKIGEREIVKAISEPINRDFSQKMTFTRRANGKGN